MNCPYFCKICTTCGKLLVAHKINFKKSSNGKYNFYSQCKKCEKIYRENNKEYYSKYREEHRDKQREYTKQHYINNSKKYKEKAKKQREENKESISNYKKEWAKNNEKHLKEYKHNHYIENKEQYWTRAHNRRIKENKQGDGITEEQFKELILFFDYKCAYSGESFSKKNQNKRRTLDHIIAINNNGDNEIWNLVPMCQGYIIVLKELKIC